MVFDILNSIRFFGFWGDEPGFVCIMVIFILIVGVIAWRFDDKSLIEQTDQQSAPSSSIAGDEQPTSRIVGFAFWIAFVVIYSVVIIVPPVIIVQDAYNWYFNFLSYVAVVMVFSAIFFMATKQVYMARPTKRLRFVCRIFLIHAVFGLLLLLFATYVIFSGGLESV
ncbi:MAG: hypothetical protein CMJ76_06335 [Planctomycetaceae bacterium]|nr:hypothetical protein [Planctomycetaceae bacterium]|tara:strand:- start:1171 stop:1671 length:501 start_codon:yes stop_codon:yes gene_type:complete